MRMRSNHAVLASAVLIAMPMTSLAQRSYTLTDVGTGWASGISNSASNPYVVGGDRGNPEHAFRWQNGARIDLGTLSGSGQSYAKAVNTAGEVVGWSGHAFLWLPQPAYGLPAGMSDLGTLGGSYSYATGINDSGQVVGWAETQAGTGIDHAFVWESGGMTDLGTLDGFDSSYAYGINASGQVVGTCWTVGGVSSACLWQDSGGGWTVTDLGAFGAQGINASGQVVGGAILWLPASAYGLPAGMNNLGPLSRSYPNTYAVAINSGGTIIGWARETYPGIRVRAWVWDSVRGMRDLNSLIPRISGLVLQNAGGINDAGQIVASGPLNNVGKAFLLTPR